MTSTVLYFSPTHTCRQAAETIRGALCAYGACTLYSATLPEERERLRQSGVRSTLLVVVCPVYAQRPPALFSRFLNELPVFCRGAVIICLYGGISAGASVRRLYRLFSRRSIPVCGAAEHPSLHAYRGEPHAKLLQECAPFALPADFWTRVLCNLRESAGIDPPEPRFSPGCLLPQTLAAKLGVRFPKRSKRCTACGRCQKSCPTGALSGKKERRSLCIRCGACSMFCPNSARTLRFTCPVPAVYLSLHAKKPKKPVFWIGKRRA